MGCEAGLAWADENKVEAIFIRNDGTVIKSMQASVSDDSVQPSMPLMTLAGSTPVSFMSRPWKG